jgi:hypothetical protein
MPCQWTVRVRNIEDPFELGIPVRAFGCREQTASSADHDSMRAAASLQLHRGLDTKLDQDMVWIRLEISDYWRESEDKSCEHQPDS